MNNKYTKLIETLPKESEELWFEYNLEVNKIIQENQQLKEKLDCDLQWAFKYEKQVDNWNKLKEWLKEKDNNGFEKLYLEDIVYKIVELERGVSDVED